MLGIVRRDEFEFQRWLKKQHAKAVEQFEAWGLPGEDMLNTEVGWLICLGKWQDKPLIFDMFQVGLLLNDSRFRAVLKSRQIGFSFIIACESIARCHLKDRHQSVCVSYNLEDAKEKVTMVKELHDELPLEFQKKIVIDSKTQVGFQSNSSKRRISKVVSNPAKPPRGKSGDVYLDELAHCINDREIYGGSTALISRSGGQLTIGSSPLGQTGLFHDVITNDYDYPGFSRQTVPWWLCRHFSKISSDESLISLCSTLPTKERVYHYGTRELIDQFEALPLEDFQQEFECAFQDERVAFFPYHVIDPCCQKERSQIPVYSNIRLLGDVAAKLGPLYLGFDVGRSRNPSELFVFEKQGPLYITRYEQSLKDIPFPRQRELMFEVGDVLGQHWVKWRIDETGMGKNLAEDLVKKFGSKRVEPITFTSATKERMANSLRILLEEGNIVLPRCRNIRAQIHSIKQRFTSAGNTIFDAERNRHHHADKMWAIALGTVEDRKRKVVVGTEIHIRSVGVSQAAAPEVNMDEPQMVQAQALPATTEGGTVQASGEPVGLVEQLFTLPGEGSVQASGDAFPTAEEVQARERNEMDAMTDADLVATGKALLTAGRVYKRSGDEDKSRAAHARYQRIRREVKRRLAVRRLTVRQP